MELPWVRSFLPTHNLHNPLDILLVPPATTITFCGRPFFITPSTFLTLFQLYYTYVPTLFISHVSTINLTLFYDQTPCNPHEIPVLYNRPLRFPTLHHDPHLIPHSLRQWRRNFRDPFERSLTSVIVKRRQYQNQFPVSRRSDSPRGVVTWVHVRLAFCVSGDPDWDGQHPGDPSLPSLV